MVAYVVPGARCLQAAQHKFPRQLPLYTEAEMKQHMHDDECQHVLCDICEQYVYDQQELHEHTQRYHPCCLLCAEDEPFESVEPLIDHLRCGPLHSECLELCISKHSLYAWKGVLIAITPQVQAVTRRLLITLIKNADHVA